MLKLNFVYEESCARLHIEGLPDYSQGHNDQQLGILSLWRLELIGTTELEGKLEHLKSLMLVVMQYSRYCLSGINKSFGGETSPVSISQNNGKHQLILRSSQVNIEPMKLLLDDSELADLVRCLDSLRLDPRVKVYWQLPRNEPLSRQERSAKASKLKNFATPFLGVLSFVLIMVLGIVVPVPEESIIPTDPKEQISESS